MTYTKQEYLSEITKEIPFEKFKTISIFDPVPSETWVKFEGDPIFSQAIFWRQVVDTGFFEVGIIAIPPFPNPPVTIEQIGFGYMDIEVDEIPDEVAEKSLKALYPSSLLPLLLLGAGVLLIPLIGRKK